MESNERQRGFPGSLKSVRRTAVRLAKEALVESSFFEWNEGPPLVLRPAVADVNLAAWAESNRERIAADLLAHGAVLFRGFGLETVEHFERAARAVTPDLLDYVERAAPRTEVGKNVYTSTEFPATHPIPLHHEMSYSHNWPAKVWFFCVRPADELGATPLAPDRAVYPRIDPEVKRTFEAKKVMYVRNYGEGVDLPWQDAFQTSDRAEVEAYCRKVGTTVEWRGDDRLRTRQVRQAVATHPATGEVVWFNHAHMFHISNVDPTSRAYLTSQFDDDELPRNAFYGDGTPIPDAVLDHVREVYAGAAVRFSWEAGDVLLVDNFLVSHGREPYTGPRKIVVAMAELFTNRTEIE